MDEVKILRKLAASAGEASPPLIDVSGPVLARLRRGGAVRKSPCEPVYWFFSAAATAAAAAVVFMVVNVGLPRPEDPLLTMFKSALTLIQ